MQLAMLASHSRARPGPSVGAWSGRAEWGPPAWRCWKNGVGKPAKLLRKEAGCWTVLVQDLVWTRTKTAIGQQKAIPLC